MDCGGVCPPCNFEPTVVNSFLSTKVNGEPVSFATFTLVKSPDWILSFENDSINIQVNLGQGDSLGGRPMNVLYSSATYNTENHSRSEEHTSELQSRPHLVCRLLLEKKKKKKITNMI